MKIKFDVTPKEFIIVKDILEKYLQDDGKAWVFGSRAKSSSLVGSDLDLAIERQDKVALKLLSQIKIAFEDSRLPYRVDVVDMKAVKPYFKELIKDEMVVFPLKYLNTVPALRFPEFSGEWTEHLLKNVFEIFNGYAFPSSASSDDGVKWVKIANVGIQNMKYADISFLPQEYAEKQNKFLLKSGDYVVALTRPILNGKLKIAKLDNFFDGSLLNQRVGKLVSSQSLCFIYNILQRTNIIKKIDDNISGSEPPNLSPNEIKSIRLHIPTIQEQQKIASFLTEVDNKIEQLTKKKQLLADYKKGVMQQIFSQEIHFKQDDGNNYPDWEVKALGDIGSWIGGGTPETVKPEFWNGDIQWFTPTELKSKYVHKSRRTISDLGLKKSSAKIIPIGAILLSTRATVGDASITLGECTTNQGFQSVEVNDINSNEFIYYWLKMNKKEIVRKASGSTFLEISKSELSKIKIKAPSFSEQQKTANFLSEIDTKINQVEKQLAGTKQFKSGLLQQMFV